MSDLSVVNHLEGKVVDLRDTGYKDMFGKTIYEGDILVGKTDTLHPMNPGFENKERDFVKENWMTNMEGERQFVFWNWNGHKLENVCCNVKKVGNMFDNPELMLSAKNV